MCKIYFGILSNNRLETLKKTINSILTSNIENYEIIIYNNSFNKKLDLFLNNINNNNITIIHNIDSELFENESYGRNRIIDKVLELSKDNDYLRFIDDDDYFNSIGLNNEYKIIKNKNNDMIFVNRIINNDYRGINLFVNPNLIYSGISNYYISTFLLKNNSDIYFDEKIHTKFCEDVIFYSKFMNVIYKFNNYYKVLFLDLDFSYYCYKIDRFTKGYYNVSSDYYKKITTLLIIDILKILNIDSPILKKELNIIIPNFKKYFNYIYSKLRDAE